MYKKILILLFTLFLLSSCGSDDKALPSLLINYDSKDFSISIPSTWDIVTNKDKVLPEPSSGNIELAVSSKNIKAGFSNNLLILSDKLKSFTSSRDFSVLNNVGAQKDYLGYRKLNSKNIIFDDGEESVLYIFEARYNLNTPKLKFIQTAHICNQNKAFFLTIALLPSVKDTGKYESIIKTFRCIK